MKLSDFDLADDLELGGTATAASPPAPALPSSKSPVPATVAPEAPGETETLLLDLWREALASPASGLDDNFFELGGHSLHALKLVHLIHQRLGVEVPFTILYRASTVRSLAQCLLDAAKFGHAAIDQTLVCLSATTDAPPLFAFPPGTADALGYAPLAAELPDFTFYAFNFPEVPQPAEHYADLITSTQPHGPYRLVGYSGGGNLAYRTALVLQRRGLPVSVIAMIDASRFFEDFTFPPDEPRRLAREFLDAAEAKAHATSPLLCEKVMRNIQRYYDHLSSDHEVEPVDASIHVIASENSPDAYHGADGRIISSRSGWADVTRGHFHLHQGHGEHGVMLHQPHRGVNAGLLRAILGTPTSAGAVSP